MQLSRRVFLQAASALGLQSVPFFLLRAAQSAPAGVDDGILVVLQLSGGNDGLNTVVPHEDPAYHRARPSLALRDEGLAPLRGPGADGLALHAGLRPLAALFEEGSLAVVQGVGYPNPSRSHFRAMDIWHTARPEEEDVERGWLGRAVEADRRRLPTLDIGDERLPLALRSSVQIPTLKNLDWLSELATPRGRAMRGVLRQLHERPRGEGPVEAVRALAASSLAELDSLAEIRGRSVPVEYPDSALADKLRWVGQMIEGGAGTRIYYLSQGGFDTHAQQKAAHAQLLDTLGQALGAFHAHLRAAGAASRVAVYVFSEFGRRVRENGSLGTDHGVAAPNFILSGRVRGGVLGAHPSLDDLDDGDLRFHTDFRRVYASLLGDILGVDPASVLGGGFEPLPLFVRRRAV